MTEEQRKFVCDTDDEIRRIVGRAAPTMEQNTLAERVWRAYGKMRDAYLSILNAQKEGDLRLRNLIATKEGYIAQANRELSLGDWQCDWGAAIREVDKEIEALSSPPRVSDEDWKALYHELLYAVERKFPNETRHQTALRYIQNAEKVTVGVAKQAETK